AGRGGGVYFERTYGLEFRLLNTLVALNGAAAGPDLFGAFTSLGNNLIGNPAGSTGWVASDLLRVDPLLAPLADYGGPTPTHALVPESPAVGAGIPGAATFDQRGIPRDPERPSIGAYEFVEEPARSL